MCHLLDNHHHINQSLCPLTKTIIRYISLYHNQKKYFFKIILIDYKLNNILNKQSLLFETLSSNGYVLYVRQSYLYGQMVWHSTLVESLQFKSTWRSNKKQTKVAIINFKYFNLFKLCQFLVIYNDPNLSVKLLDSSK